MRFIGDVHGKFHLYKAIINNTADQTIQVGDMGIGFSGDENYHAADKDRFINGNHDDPKKCATFSNFISSPYQENGMFFLGGGFSIDKEWRIPGISWWENEELSISELEKAIKTYDECRPRIMVTHEAPVFLAYHMVRDVYPPSRTSLALQAMIEIHRPELWIYGHWHLNFREQVDKTQFICLPECNYIDVDLDQLEISHTKNYYREVNKK